MPHHVFAFFLRIPFFLRILFIALFFIFSFGVLIWIIEPETFTTILDGIWWAIITVSTVGYGDLVPQTIFGRILGALLILLGAGFLSAYFVALSSAAVKKQTDLLEGNVMFKGKGHFIIIGWNERSRAIIDKQIKTNLDRMMVLIDESLESHPYSDYHVHFIKGRANKDEILLKANIAHAEKVLITADQNKDELQADMNTIITLLAIKGLNPGVTCIVEILTDEQAVNAKRAGADEVIQSNVISASVMMNSLHSKDAFQSLVGLLEQFKGSRFLFYSSTDFIGKSFSEANELLLMEGSLLFGIKRGADTIVNPPQPFYIKESDILLVIAGDDQ